MRNRWIVLKLISVVLAIAPGLALSQTAPQGGNLTVTGHSGEIPIFQSNGRSYVDLEAFARLTSSSLAFKGSQVILTLPAASDHIPEVAPQPTPGFSKSFLNSGIEFMATIREWRSELMNAVQNGYPVTDDWMSRYQGPAATSLRLATVAAATDSDHSAAALLSNEYNNMKTLSDRIVAARRNLSYIAPDSLNNDPLNQQILNCAHALASMASSGHFQDDPSCH